MSLRTRRPKEAGTLARRLAVCGDTITKHIEASGMNHGELRTQVYKYFAVVLDKAKTRKYKGRKPTAKAKSVDVIALASEGIGATEISRRLGIGRASVYRILSARQ